MVSNMLLSLVSLVLLACASSSAQRVGSASYAPLPAGAEVQVFTDANQLKQPYEVVGLVSYDDPGKYHVLTVGDAIEPLKAKARELGANAIIMGQSHPVKSGIWSTGIYAEAQAIRIKGQ